MAPLAIDTTSHLGLFSVLPLVLLPFSLPLWPTSPSSFWPPFHSACSSFLTPPFFNPGSLACFLVTTQADRSSGEASSTSSHVVTRNVAFRAGSLITDSHALMGCSEMASEIGCVSSTLISGPHYNGLSWLCAQCLDLATPQTLSPTLS